MSDQHCSDCCNDFFFVSGCKEQLLNSSSLLDLLDECICDQHWTMQYYVFNQHVVLTKGVSDSLHSS